jgi:hypothetical protein
MLLVTIFNLRLLLPLTMATPAHGQRDVAEPTSTPTTFSMPIIHKKPQRIENSVSGWWKARAAEPTPTTFSTAPFEVKTPHEEHSVGGWKAREAEPTPTPTATFSMLPIHKKPQRIENSVSGWWKPRGAEPTSTTLSTAIFEVKTPHEEHSVGGWDVKARQTETPASS